MDGSNRVHESDMGKISEMRRVRREKGRRNK